MTDLLNIIVDEFGIWLVSYISSSVVYIIHKDFI